MNMMYSDWKSLDFQRMEGGKSVKLITNVRLHKYMKNSILIFSIAFVLISVISYSYEEVNADNLASITQQKLKMMVEDWMDNPDKDDTAQRLEIMKSYYAFEETGQQLSHDQEGLVLMNQIRKMVSLQLPKADLDELRHQVRVELGLEAPSENKILYVNSKLVDCVGVGMQKCMQVRENNNDDWENFYDHIEGFDYSEGQHYKIFIKVTDVKNPPADASSKKYELVEILETKSYTKHIPYLNVCAPGFVSLGEICVLNDRCGPGVYPGKICVMDGIEQPYLKPRQQGHAGLAAANVICAQELNLIFKSHDGTPACVSDSSVTKLKERGWQTSMPTLACPENFAPVCGVDGMTYGNMCVLDSNHVVLKNIGECGPKPISADVLRYTWQPPEFDLEKGYFVSEIADGVYWLSSNGYQTMFVTTGQGVVVVDAPQPIGEKYIEAINDVTAEPITHMIYSHSHQDHTGAAGQIFPTDITYISHKKTADILESENDPNRPVPTETFDGEIHMLSIGDKNIELHHIGDFHSDGDILILLPDHKVAMLVDLLRPAESPYRAFGVTPDIDLYLKTHDILQDFDFDVLVSGHTSLLATKDHIKTNKDFTQSVMDNAQMALDANSSNPVEICSQTTIEQWEGKLGNLETFMNDHCAAMVDYLT